MQDIQRIVSLIEAKTPAYLALSDKVWDLAELRYQEEKSVKAQIEALARREGFSQLVLETGLGLEAAWHVYERAGFTRCGPVLTYPDIPTSVFYEKSLKDFDLGDRKPDRTAQ